MVPFSQPTIYPLYLVILKGRIGLENDLEYEMEHVGKTGIFSDCDHHPTMGLNERIAADRVVVLASAVWNFLYPYVQTDRLQIFAFIFQVIGRRLHSLRLPRVLLQGQALRSMHHLRTIMVSYYFEILVTLRIHSILM